MNPPVLPPHPLDRPGVVKIALGREASAAVSAIGPHSLIIATRADSTAPAAQGRVVLHCMNISKELANDAYRVACGQMRASKIKTSKS